MQINVLPQRHGCDPYVFIDPFELDEKGNYDFYRINDSYFKNAELMLEMAVEEGFIPALAVLWANYVPDTWQSNCGDASRHPRVRPFSDIIPMEAMKKYVEYVAVKFSRFNPIYLVSGDTNFPSDLTISYYRMALEILKRLSPQSLTTLHTIPRATLNESFVNSSLIDFYMYQSGHRYDEQHLNYKLAEKCRSYAVKRPVVNGEPCYEGHRHFDGNGERFTAFDVRKAFWQSVLSGANAGFAYGAHGIWTWKKEGSKFSNTCAAGLPHSWRESLVFDGAWDVSFGKKLFELYEFYDLEPANHVLNNTDEIRMAKTRDSSKLAIYVPYSTELELNMDLSDYDLSIINLQDKRMFKGDIDCSYNQTIIKMPEFNGDYLVIGTK